MTSRTAQEATRMSAKKPDEWGRDIAYEEACECGPDSIGEGICRNFNRLFYRNWPRSIRNVGAGNIGTFYRHNRTLLRKQNTKENAIEWAKIETEHFRNTEFWLSNML